MGAKIQYGPTLPTQDVSITHAPSNKERPVHRIRRPSDRPHRETFARTWRCIFIVAAITSACDGEDSEQAELSRQLRRVLETTPTGLQGFILPESSQLAQIPQDPNNPLTSEKVRLGQMLFHDPVFATDGRNSEATGTWSCASCHHAQAGFKSGLPQGIGEGGVGFGDRGEGRRLAAGFDPASPDPQWVPDVQPLASPTVLNVAFQDVMLWNGQFGNGPSPSANTGIERSRLAPPDTPKELNLLGLSGVETQAIAAIAVHRLGVVETSPLQTDTEYTSMYEAAFPAGGDALENAGKAIAAYERTVLANEAPFQRWLRNDETALTASELRGALLFFGEARCVDCHVGPALSSLPGSSDLEVFFAVGFGDLDGDDPRVHGPVDGDERFGRASFTQRPQDRFKFKIPQLYNLADAPALGHGASFETIRAVVTYKNAAVAQASDAVNIDPGFVPLDLTADQLDDLVAFLEHALYDPNLSRYVPTSVPSGGCVPVADPLAIADLGCP